MNELDIALEDPETLIEWLHSSWRDKRPGIRLALQRLDVREKMVNGFWLADRTDITLVESAVRPLGIRPTWGGSNKLTGWAPI